MPLRITSEKNQPSLPANYVSLADLQQRWLNQQQQKRGKEELQQKNQHQRKTEKKEPQKSYLGMQDDVEKNVNPKPQFQEPRNPNFKPRSQFRGNHRNRKGPKELKIEGTAKIRVEIDGRCHPVDDLRVKDEQTMNKKSEKKVPKSEPLKIEATIALMDGQDRPVEDLRVKNEKTMERKSKKKVPKSEPSEIEATVEEKVKSDGQDQIGGEEKIKDEKKKKNKKAQMSVPEKQNPAMNGELGNDQTAEIGQRFDKLSVNRREERGNGRWTAGIEGSRRVNQRQSYGRVNRVMERKWRDNGLIWVKKEDVADNTVI